MTKIMEPATEPDVPFGSNLVRLSPKQWLVAAALIVALFTLLPILWERLERFDPGPDYRVPYAYSRDYWQYRHYSRNEVAEDKILLVGDSVIWGQYVPADATLSHYLNESSSGERFSNLGLDGTHPAALAGLLNYYGAALARKKVILHANPLWMSSPRHDLQEPKEFRFNHPNLVPQFYPPIPCYRQTISSRIGIALTRHSSFFSWTKHLQIAFFNDQNLPAWMINHPYRNPLSQVSLSPPSLDNDTHQAPLSWIQRGINRQDLAWVNLNQSFQWHSFRRAIDILQKRNCQAFVILGPFNEHVLTDNSRQVYQNLKQEITTWLQQHDIPFYAPSVLPSSLYADASHPLSEGYALLARQLREHEPFSAFCSNTMPSPTP